MAAEARLAAGDEEEQPQDCRNSFCTLLVDCNDSTIKFTPAFQAKGEGPISPRRPIKSTS